VQALELVAGRLHGDAELADRVVEEAHLLVGDAEIEARLVVVDAELLLDAGLEGGEDLLEALLLGAAGGRRARAGRALVEGVGELGGEVEVAALGVGRGRRGRSGGGRQGLCRGCGSGRRR